MKLKLKTSKQTGYTYLEAPKVKEAIDGLLDYTRELEKRIATLEHLEDKRQSRDANQREGNVWYTMKFNPPSTTTVSTGVKKIAKKVKKQTKPLFNKKEMAEFKKNWGEV